MTDDHKKGGEISRRALGALTVGSLLTFVNKEAAASNPIEMHSNITWMKSNWFHFQKGIKGLRRAGKIQEPFPVREVLSSYKKPSDQAYRAVEQIYDQFSARVVDPCGGLKEQPEYSLEAIDRIALPPMEGSRELFRELLELYWAAALRDVRFSEYSSNELCRLAYLDLSEAGLNLRTPDDLFQSEWCRSPAHRLSRMLTAPVLEWPDFRHQKYRSFGAGSDYLGREVDWTRAQSGENSVGRVWLASAQPDYINTGRNLATLVYLDHPSQYFISACLILYQIRDRVWPRRGSLRHQFRRTPFVMGGLPDLISHVAACCQVAMEACWRAKWGHFQYPRPEEVAYWTKYAELGEALFSIREQLMSTRLFKEKFGGSFPLLSQVYPEGSPGHPSYPGGHAVAAGASVTIIKAFMRADATIPPDLSPYEARHLHDSNTTSVLEDLDCLAWNVAVGRMFAGIHYRCDNTAGLLLGQDVAIGYLRNLKKTYPFDANFTLTTFENETVQI